MILARIANTPMFIAALKERGVAGAQHINI